MSEAKRVFSSHIDSIAYDAATHQFTVNWSRGGASVYDGVPPDIARSVIDAPSIGEALHMHIRGRYAFATLKPE